MGAADVDTLVLERLAVGAWIPDEVENHRGWLLRAADGFTGRGNSALVLAPPSGGVDDHLAYVAQWYRARALPPMLAVALPRFRDLADQVQARGWTAGHGGRVLVADLRDLPGMEAGAARPYAVTVDHECRAPWLARHHPRGGELPDVGHRMLRRGDRVGFASASLDGDVVAIGRGVVVDGWLGINAVETAVAHRRRGLATRILEALVDWARARGATRAFLQVDLSNDVAHDVYRRAGFVDHHTYRYVVGPGAGSTVGQQGDMQPSTG